MMSTSIDSTGSEHRRHGNQSESSQNKYEEEYKPNSDTQAPHVVQNSSKPAKVPSAAHSRENHESPVDLTPTSSSASGEAPNSPKETEPKKSPRVGNTNNTDIGRRLCELLSLRSNEVEMAKEKERSEEFDTKLQRLREKGEQALLQVESSIRILESKAHTQGVLDAANYYKEMSSSMKLYPENCRCYIHSELRDGNVQNKLRDVYGKFNVQTTMLDDISKIECKEEDDFTVIHLLSKVSIEAQGILFDKLREKKTETPCLMILQVFDQKSESIENMVTGIDNFFVVGSTSPDLTWFFAEHLDCHGDTFDLQKIAILTANKLDKQVEQKRDGEVTSAGSGLTKEVFLKRPDMWEI